MMIYFLQIRKTYNEVPLVQGNVRKTSSIVSIGRGKASLFLRKSEVGSEGSMEII